MTGNPAKLFDSLIYRVSNFEHRGKYEFLLAQVDWDWRYADSRNEDWEMEHACYELREMGRIHDDVDLYNWAERQGTDRWFEKHRPDIREFLIERGVEYQVSSSGHSYRSGMMLRGVTVAALCIAEPKIAMELRLRYC